MPRKLKSMRGIIIAIDGHSSCGKSTLAKDLAKALQYTYVDSGAMYRAVTLYLLRAGVNFDEDKSITQALENITIHFENSSNGNRVFLNDEDVSEEIRQMHVSQSVSPVAAISRVRRAMVQQQQRMGQQGAIVMDGRDIGTVVFPNADLKIFLTASIEERTRRRYSELKAKGLETNFEAVRANLLERDHIDSTRADSPLMQAPDAILIDNTNLSQIQQLNRVLDLAKAKIQKHALSPPSNAD